MPALLKKVWFQLLVTVLLSAALIWVGSFFCRYHSPTVTDSDFERATVQEVIAVTEESGLNNTVTKTVFFRAVLTSGKQKGTSFSMTQTLDEMMPPVPRQVEPGDRILVVYSEPSEKTGSISGWSYAGSNHTLGTAVLIGAFLLIILLIGRSKGITTILSLLLTIAAVFLVYLPSVLRGQNIYFMTILVSLFVILSSLCTLNGWNRKTLCAVVGNAGGVLAAGILSFFINRAFGITGILNQDYLFLTMLEGGVQIDLKALIWGGILIGSLGAVMDVAMSLASAMYELSEQMYEPTVKRLLISGMNIGRDAIGTMTNTLILAYVGGSMATILLFFAYTQDIAALLNYEMLLVEIIQSVVGSAGILLAVPITVFFSAWLLLLRRSAESN